MKTNIFHSFSLPGWSLVVVLLGSPCMAAVLTVTDAGDAGGKTLRKAIGDAKSGDTIRFQNSLSGKTITLKKGQLEIAKDLVIDASGLSKGITIDAGGRKAGHRVMEISKGADVELNSLTITGGSTADGNSLGGGIFNSRGKLIIRNSVITGNATGGGSPDNPFLGGANGGGIYSIGPLTIRDSVVTGNSTGDGGALVGGGWGGGVYCEGALVIQTSTVSNNSTGDGGGSSSGGLGGGVFSAKSLTVLNSTISGNSTGDGLAGGQGGGIFSSGSLDIENSTIEGNSTGNGSGEKGGEGGGIYAIPSNQSNSMNVVHATVANNKTGRPRADGGGLFVFETTRFNLTNSLIVENSASGNGGDLLVQKGAKLQASGVNLVSDDSGFKQDSGPKIAEKKKPLLDSLADNGGSTQTMLPLAGSPAVDPANGDTKANGNDQRGLPRLQGSTVDVGAVEVQKESLPQIVVEGVSGQPLASGGFGVGFGAVQTGSTAGITFTIRNTGDADLTGLTITANGKDAADFQAGPVDDNRLSPGSSTTFSVIFSPGGTGIRSAELRIGSNDDDRNPFVVPVDGEGVDPVTPLPGTPAGISVEHSSGNVLTSGKSNVSFGTVQTGSSSGTTFTVRNTGGSDLTGLSVSSSGPNRSDFSVGGLGRSELAPGASTTFTVIFSPSATGSRSASVAISGNISFNLSLVGTGAKPSGGSGGSGGGDSSNPPPGSKAPEIVVQQGKGKKKNLRDGKSRRNLGTVRKGKKSKPMTFKIRNTGNAKLKKLRVRISGKGRRDFRLVRKPGTKTLKPGKATKFRLVFRPRNKGTSKAQLKIRSNDANENPFDIKLRGKGR